MPSGESRNGEPLPSKIEARWLIATAVWLKCDTRLDLR